jgi:cytochrome b involved in lipid metabolism
LAEVAEHPRESDCWIAIDGLVYDITAYLPDHPSEPELILPWCGKEATQAWRTKGKGRPHSPRASQLLEKYKIGALR